MITKEEFDSEKKARDDRAARNRLSEEIGALKYEIAKGQSRIDRLTAQIEAVEEVRDEVMNMVEHNLNKKRHEDRYEDEDLWKELIKDTLHT